MPQEIVIPVITLRESENQSAKTRAVEFSLLGSSNKVVTNKQRFEFIQTEPVSERVLARSVLVSLRDGETMISDEQSLTFDSSSGPDGRAQALGDPDHQVRSIRQEQRPFPDCP
ncbi:MAG: hypothetical protein V5B40_06110 [Candidatus Accumulibacter meliphilus]|jgi:hypothetical protein|uniref:hypothetical protein n=1 Tax=Candidatus Accumulibacter meliphilus TaxID=2211374 RepID=UPI002FC37235